MAASKMHFPGQVGDADLRLLKVFKTVVESGGFTAAEVELNVTGAAISTSMTNLEKRLGFRLCLRGRTGFSLTDAGRQVYEHTLQLLGSLDTFRSQVNSIHSSLRGELSIGITDNLVSLRRKRIVNSLQHLKRQAPDVTLSISVMPPNEIEKGVLNGSLHVGMVPQLRALPGIDSISMYEEESGLYCGKQHPLFSLADKGLTVEQILQYDAVSPSYAQHDSVSRIYERHKLSATVSDREGVAFLLLTGCFIGYLPTHYAETWVREGCFRRLLPEQFGYSVPYTAISRSGNKNNLVLNSYLEALQGTE